MTAHQLTPAQRAALAVLAGRWERGDGPARISTTTDPMLGLVHWGAVDRLIDHGLARLNGDSVTWAVITNDGLDALNPTTGQDPASEVQVTADNWLDHAACRGTNPNDWHPNGGNSDHLLATCQACPARTHCLEDALSRDKFSDHGIWGGTTAKDRRRIRRQRREQVSA